MILSQIELFTEVFRRSLMGVLWKSLLSWDSFETLSLSWQLPWNFHLFLQQGNVMRLSWKSWDQHPESHMSCSLEWVPRVTLTGASLLWDTSRESHSLTRPSWNTHETLTRYFYSRETLMNSEYNVRASEACSLSNKNNQMLAIIVCDNIIALARSCHSSVFL